MAQVFDAGECFIRKHYRKFGYSKVPYALELIEAERIADDLASPTLSVPSGNEVRMGVEVDRFFRPVAYFIRRRHPSELRFSPGVVDEIERVPAEQIIHLAEVNRWPQTRGEPWLHAAAGRLKDLDGYGEAEIVKSRKQANESGWIQTPEDAEGFAERMEDGSFEEDSEPGVYKVLRPGEEVINPPATAPNSVYRDFVGAVLREIAAGTGPSYESLSRDYSQSNYSSSRLALLDDRDLWRFYQSWFICDFRYIVHKEWLAQAVLAGAIESIAVEQYAVNPKKFESVRFKPRGWTWIDPTKEVEAFKEAIKQGFTTVTDVIAATAGGQDIEDILTTRTRELELMEGEDLVFETSPEFYMADVEKAKAQAKAAANPKPPPDPEGTDSTEKPAPSRLFNFGGRR
jgi:lambda family phage portal protein